MKRVHIYYLGYDKYLNRQFSCCQIVFTDDPFRAIGQIAFHDSTAHHFEYTVPESLSFDWAESLQSMGYVRSSRLRYMKYE